MDTNWRILDENENLTELEMTVCFPITAALEKTKLPWGTRWLVGDIVGPTSVSFGELEPPMGLHLTRDEAVAELADYMRRLLTYENGDPDE